VSKFRKLLIFFASMAAAAMLTGCSAESPSHKSDASLKLRTYAVPDGDAKAVSIALNQVLGLDHDQHGIGRTYWSGPAQVLVLAPARLQDSIADSIKQITSQNQFVTGDRPLRLNVWIVDVYQGAGALDPNLKTIQSALQSFEEDSAPAHFAQRHYFTEVSDTGADTVMSPLPSYRLDYSITEKRDRLMLKFHYGHHIIQQGAEVLSGEVATRLGQTLVLGLLATPPAGAGGSSKVNHAAQDARQPGLRYKLLVIRIVPATQG
jgi:hypothetical protein